MPPARRRLSRVAPGCGPGPHPPRASSPGLPGRAPPPPGPCPVPGTSAPRNRSPVHPRRQPSPHSPQRKLGLSEGGPRSWHRGQSAAPAWSPPQKCRLALPRSYGGSAPGGEQTRPRSPPHAHVPAQGADGRGCPLLIIPLGGYAQNHSRVSGAEGGSPRYPPSRQEGSRPGTHSRTPHARRRPPKAARCDQPQAPAGAPGLGSGPCPATLAGDPETEGQRGPGSRDTGLAVVQAGTSRWSPPASPAQPPHGSLRDVEPAVGGRECPRRLIRGCHSVPMATAAEHVFQDRLRLGLSCQNTHHFGLVTVVTQVAGCGGREEGVAMGSEDRPPPRPAPTRSHADPDASCRLSPLDPTQPEPSSYIVSDPGHGLPHPLTG